MDFSGHLPQKKKKKASKCALHGGGGRDAHKVVMFWLGLGLSLMPVLCLA